MVQPVAGGAASPPPIDGSPADRLDPDAFNRFEAAGWEARASSYAFLGPITGRVIGPLLAAVQVAPGVQLLDVGCGPGDLAAAAALAGADAVGIDIAPSMVRRAALAHPSIPFRVGSFEALPGGAGAFDAVVGNFVFNHVGRPPAALAEARRVLRADGRLALSTWDAPGRNRVLGVVLDAVEAAEAPPPAGLPPGPTNFRTDEELRSLFEAAGFVDVAVTQVRFEAPVASAEVLWRGVLDSAVRIPPLVTGQPSPVQARIRRLFDELCAAHEQTDGTLSIPVAVQVTHGRRP